MALLATIIGISARTTVAANVETLLMPGKLTASHAKLEENCGACHDKSDRLRQTPLCLDCHKDIAKDIAAQRGHHGHLANADKTQCRACHTDHKGRNADIVNFAANGFNHDLTEFSLQGAHIGLACQNCHKPNVKYRKAETACIACHRDRDVHKNSLGEVCATCHEAAAWTKVRFDHEKTEFPLREVHTKLECASCHFGPRYKGTPKRCNDCHAPDDVHKGSRGEECGKCHNSTSWKTAKFDHEKETVLL